MKETNIRNKPTVTAGIALIYFLLDYFVLKIGYLPFGYGIGLKNALPPVTGLFFGPYAAFGMCAGTLLSAAFVHRPAAELFAELFCVFAMSLGMWEIWHRSVDRKRVRMKRLPEMITYVVLTGLFSGFCGIVTQLFTGKEGGVTFCSYLLSGVFMGLPVLMLLADVFCVRALLPGKEADEPDIRAVIEGVGPSLAAVIEELQEKTVTAGYSGERSLELLSAVEEIYTRIEKGLPGVPVYIFVRFMDPDISDGISLRIYYEGARHNPFLRTENEDEADIAGLKLIMYRALRASHTYEAEENRIHVVL